MLSELLEDKIWFKLGEFDNRKLQKHFDPINMHFSVAYVCFFSVTLLLYFHFGNLAIEDLCK